MTSRQALYILIALLLLSAVHSGVYGEDRASLSGAVGLALHALVLAFTYLWYYQDASERNFKRSTALGAAIVLFSVVSVPYYLIKSRPKGRRVTSTLKYAAICGVFLSALIVSAGISQTHP